MLEGTTLKQTLVLSIKTPPKTPPHISLSKLSPAGSRKLQRFFKSRLTTIYFYSYGLGTFVLQRNLHWRTPQKQKLQKNKKVGCRLGDLAN